MEDGINNDKPVTSVASDQPENLVVKTPNIKMAYGEPFMFQEDSKVKRRKPPEEILDEDCGSEYGNTPAESQEEDLAVHAIEAVTCNTRAHDYFEMINESHGRCLLCNREIRRKKYNFQMHLQHRHPHVLQSILPMSSVVKRRIVKPAGPSVTLTKEDSCGGDGSSSAILSSNKLNEALCTWICADLIPLHQLESEHFRRFVWTLNDSYDLLLPTFLETLLPEFEKRTEFNILQELQGTSSMVLSLCLDIWNCTKYGRPCLILMANYIDKEWSQQTYCLGVALLDRHHLFYGILGKIMESLKKYSVHQVTAVVTNGHPEVAKACEQLNAVSYVCIAHQLQSFLLPLLNECGQLLVNDGDENHVSINKSLKNLVQAVNKARQITKLLKESPFLWEHYCCLFESIHWPLPSAIPMDIKDRWNSTVPMLREVLKQLEYFRMASSQLHYEELFISESEKSLLMDLVELLEPFEEAVDALSSRAFPLASMIIPVIIGIKVRLKEMQHDAIEKKKPDFFNVCTWVMDKMVALSVTYEKNPHLQIATFLDPRFKGFCLSQEEENLVIKKITDEMDALLHSDLASLSPVLANAEQNPRSIFGCLFKGTANKAPVAEPDSLDYQEVRAIVCTYGKLQRLTMDTDVLHYWNDKEQQKSLSILPTIARKYLGFVATSSESKYAFTKSGDLLRDKCTALSAKYAESLLFANQNKRFFCNEPNS